MNLSLSTSLDDRPLKANDKVARHEDDNGLRRSPVNERRTLHFLA